MRALACLAVIAVAFNAAAPAAEARQVRGVQIPRPAPTPGQTAKLFTLPNYQVVQVSSALDKTPEKWVSGACPTGMKAVSGSAVGRASLPEPSNQESDGVTVQPPVGISSDGGYGFERGLSHVVSGPTKNGDGWRAEGRLAPINSDWLLELTIICVRL